MEYVIMDHLTGDFLTASPLYLWGTSIDEAERFDTEAEALTSAELAYIHKGDRVELKILPVQVSIEPLYSGIKTVTPPWVGKHAILVVVDNTGNRNGFYESHLHHTIYLSHGVFGGTFFDTPEEAEIIAETLRAICAETRREKYVMRVVAVESLL